MHRYTSKRGTPVLSGLLGQVARRFRKYDSTLKNERAHRPGILSDREHEILVKREQTGNDKEFAKIFAAEQGLLVTEPRAYGNASSKDRYKAIKKMLDDAGLTTKKAFGSVGYGTALGRVNLMAGPDVTIDQAKLGDADFDDVPPDLMEQLQDARRPGRSFCRREWRGLRCADRRDE